MLSSTGPWTIYPVFATNSLALAGVPTLDLTLNLDRGSPARPAANSSKEPANSAATGNPVSLGSSKRKTVSLGNRANKAASPVEAVKQGANPVKAVKPAASPGKVKVAASAPEARQVKPAEPWQVMSGTASPVQRAM
jgi:hypothetical protein